MTSPLEKLSGPGKSLKAEPPDIKEFEGLKRSGHARLRDVTLTPFWHSCTRDGILYSDTEVSPRIYRCPSLSSALLGGVRKSPRTDFSVKVSIRSA